jgi:hypothetical protein
MCFFVGPTPNFFRRPRERSSDLNPDVEATICPLPLHRLLKTGSTRNE